MFGPGEGVNMVLGVDTSAQEPLMAGGALEPIRVIKILNEDGVFGNGGEGA